MSTKTTQSIAERFARPLDLSDRQYAFGPTADLMPAYKEIPEEFRNRNTRNPFVALQREWFFRGLKGGWPLKPKPGIEQGKALAHLNAIQRSWEPQHEHKEAGVAYLMSLWFEPPAPA